MFMNKKIKILYLFSFIVALLLITDLIHATESDDNMYTRAQFDTATTPEVNVKEYGNTARLIYAKEADGNTYYTRAQSDIALADRLERDHEKNSSFLSKMYTKVQFGAAKPDKLEKKYKKAARSSNKLRTTTYLGGGLGYRFNDRTRIDLTFSQFNKFKYLGSNNTKEITMTLNQKIKSAVSFINFYYDLFDCDTLRPYITFGAGLARNESKSLNINQIPHITGATVPPETIKITGKVKNNFAWNVGVGLALKLSTRTYLEFDYRYIDLGKIGTQSFYDARSGVTIDPFTSKLRMQNILIALRLHF